MQYLRCVYTSLHNASILHAGHVASVTIKLVSSIIPTGFTIEHIAKEIAPGNDVSTAPKKFTLVGMEESIGKCVIGVTVLVLLLVVVIINVIMRLSP